MVVINSATFDVKINLGDLKKKDSFLSQNANLTVSADGLELGAEGSKGYPPSWIFNGVAVGPSGAIYVTGDISNVLYRIESKS